MLRSRRSSGRPKAIPIAATLIAGAFGAACVTAPPPDVPEAAEHRPIIHVESVDPAADAILTTWPGGFVVPVEVDEPSTGAEWKVLIDGMTTGWVGTITGAGTVPVPFSPASPIPPTSCHTVEFIVARKFDPKAPLTPDSLGADALTWFYIPGGGLTGCTTYDAGVDSGIGPLTDAQPEGQDP
jgi:hypothetical protein